MEEKEIFEYLCRRDERSPLYQGDERDTFDDEKCSCDNCFYGKHKLALEILSLRKKLKN